MKTKLLLLLLAASFAGNVAFVATTLAARRQHAAMPMDRLGLDSDQRARLMVVRERFVGERGHAQARMRELRRELADEVTKPAPDRARMEQAAAAMANVQAGMRPKLIAHLLDMHGLLRSEQRAGLAELLRAEGSMAMPGCPAGALMTAPADSETAGGLR